MHYGDIFLTKTGIYFGKSAVIPLEISEVNTSAHVGKISLKHGYNSWAVSTFFNSRYGYLQLRRRGIKATRPEIKLIEMNDLLIPIFTDKFNNKIQCVVLSALDFMKRADENYHAAEKMLSAALNLEKFTPSSENIAIKSFRTSFVASGRLDAEFYQPKYDDIEKKLAELSSCQRVKDFFKLVKTICDRRADFYNYIEIGDVNISNGVAVANKIATDELPDNAKIMTQADDVLVSKVRPNRGAVAILHENNLLVSGAFAVLRSNGKFSTEVLQVLLRTKIYRELMLKYNVGTSYPVIKDEDVLNLPLPVILRELQEKIAAQVSESFRLRGESEKMLSKAKTAVEIAIEQGEDAALNFLNY